MRTVRKVNVAVIGVGAWGRNHVRIYKELNNSELISICDINEVKAREVAERYGVSWTTDYTEILDNKEIEAISICTPASTHVKIALDAIRSGKHVLVEKPMGGDVRKADMIVKEANKRNVLIYVGFVERFNPGVRKVRELIQKGEIGGIILISSRRFSTWSGRVLDIGVIGDTAIHDFDLFRYIFNEDPIEVYAVVGRVKHRYEDYAEIFLRFKGGMVGIVEANWLFPKKIREMMVIGDDGTLSLNFLNQRVIVEKAGTTYLPHIDKVEPLKSELNSFINCILGNSKAEITGYDGVRALKIVEAALRSAKEDRPVRL